MYLTDNLLRLAGEFCCYLFEWSFRSDNDLYRYLFYAISGFRQKAAPTAVRVPSGSRVRGKSPAEAQPAASPAKSDKRTRPERKRSPARRGPAGRLGWEGG